MSEYDLYRTVLHSLTEAHEEIGRLRSVLNDKYNIINTLEARIRDLESHLPLTDSSQKSDEKTYHITLCNFDPQSKIPVIKWIRSETGCSLKEGKDICEGMLPRIIQTYETEELAMNARDRFIDYCDGEVRVSSSQVK